MIHFNRPEVIIDLLFLRLKYYICKFSRNSSEIVTQNSKTMIHTNAADKSISNRIVETFYSRKCPFVIHNDAPEILPRVLSKVQETPSPHFHWRNCYTSYKCISLAHSFHASASPREVAYFPLFFAVSGDFFHELWRKVAEEKSFERIQIATRAIAKCKFIHKTHREVKET